MYDNILSEEDYIKVAQKYFEEKNLKLLKHNLKPISANKKGFAGEHLRMELWCQVAGTKKQVVLFVKAKPQNSAIQKDIEDLNIYNKEIFFYTVLLHEFNKIGCDTSFGPKCYYHLPGSCVVLENITVEGFKLPPVFTFYDMDHVQAGLKSLALLHAAGYVLEEVRSKELGRTYRLGPHYDMIAQELFYVKDTLGMKWVESARTILLNLIDLLPETKSYREEFRSRLRDKEFGVPFHTDYNIRKTIGHGDLWSNNMMFKNEDGVISCCLLDYQLVRYYFPCFDVMLFLYTNTSREFRQKHTKDLIDFYFDILSAEVKRHGFNIEEIHPRKDFDETLKFALFEPLLHGLSAHTIWCYTEEYLSEVITSEDGKGFWFGDRTPDVTNYMNKNENFKKMMFDCLYDFHDLLFGC